MLRKVWRYQNGIIRRRNSKTDSQFNGLMIMDNKKSNGRRPDTTQNTKDSAIQTPLKRGELRYSRKISNSYFTNGFHLVTLVENPVNEKMLLMRRIRNCDNDKYQCFCFVCLRCWVFYAQCRLCLWIVFVLLVFAVECFMPNVACVSGLFLFRLSSLLSVLCPMSPVSLDCFCFVFLRCWVLYAHYRLCLWIVFVLFVSAVECFMPNVVCVSGLFLFCLSSLLSVLCTMSPVSLDCFCFVCLRCWVFYA
jgi:hypothetical protein